MYEHVFLHCKKVEDIWKNVITHYDLMEIRNIAWEEIFVGLLGSSFRIKFVNYLIIMLKYIIFKSRTTGTLPSFNKIQKTFLEYINAEKKLATTRGKLGEHLLKWEYVREAFVQENLFSSFLLFVVLESEDGLIRL